MTLFRMKQVHGLELSQDVHAAVLRLLADSQGLAPAQSAAGRFAVERRPNVKDMTSEADADRLCGACHTHARLSLQRRDTAEWLKLMNTHVGQWPTIEYHAQLRTRPWWPIVTTQVAPALGRCVWRVNGRDL
jgi:quinohemoprotein amine dehydrogenase